MGLRDEYHKFLYKVYIYPSFILLNHLLPLHLYQLNRFDMLNGGPRICDIHLSVISKIPPEKLFSGSSMSIIYL